MSTIRVDDEVYAWLQSQAVPFEDNPNSVLRRIAGFNSPERVKFKAAISENSGREGETKNMKKTNVRSFRGQSHSNSGKKLIGDWNLPVKQARYHQDGTFYENPRDFPCALCDPNGYVIFNTEQEYCSNPYLNIGKKLNVIRGIASIPGYRRKP